MSARHEQALAQLGLDVDSSEAPHVCALVDDGWNVLHATEMLDGDLIVVPEASQDDGIIRFADVAHVEDAGGSVLVATVDGDTWSFDAAQAVLTAPRSRVDDFLARFGLTDPAQLMDVPVERFAADSTERLLRAARRDPDGVLDLLYRIRDLGDWSAWPERQALFRELHERMDRAELGDELGGL